MKLLDNSIWSGVYSQDWFIYQKMSPMKGITLHHEYLINLNLPILYQTNYQVK